jgi:hypothetical protein
MMRVIALQFESVGTRVYHTSDSKVVFMRSVKSVDVKSKPAPHRNGSFKVANHENEEWPNS